MKGNIGRTLFHGHVRSISLKIRSRRWCLLLAVATLLLIATTARLVLVRCCSAPRGKHRGNVCHEEIHYDSAEEMEGRVHRFPSVEDRIKLYTSNWYKTPCLQSVEAESSRRIAHDHFFQRPLALKKETVLEDGGREILIFVNEKQLSNETQAREFRMDSKVLPARMFYGDKSAIQECVEDTRPSNRMRNYCEDVNNTVVSLLSSLMGYGNDGLLSYNGVPIIFQFGDAAESRAPDESGHSLLSQPRIPHLKKFRFALNRTELERITNTDRWMPADRERSCQLQVPTTIKGASRLQPIIWKLNIRRHFGRLWLVPCNDRPWHEKTNKAVFRGKLTGNVKAVHENTVTKCRSIPRCRLILEHKASKFVDARLTSTSNVLPEVIEGFNLTSPVLSMKDILSYKGIIVLEGNDVSSGLKWALLSSSVVLMPDPLFTSWAMEELLEPWIHYIPIQRDFSDLDEKIAWMIRHDAEARRISYRATLWMKDLVYHPRANEDEALIFRGILDRYSRHFDSSAVRKEKVRSGGNLN